jgi:hypothetical protein
MEIDEMVDNATKALAGYLEGANVRDLLADLMHYCGAKHINFDEELVMARANHRREVMHDLG